MFFQKESPDNNRNNDYNCQRENDCIILADDILDQFPVDAEQVSAIDQKSVPQQGANCGQDDNFIPFQMYKTGKNRDHTTGSA